MNRSLAISLAALPFAAAYGLYATGVLERIDMKIDRWRYGLAKPDCRRSVRPKPSANQPIAERARFRVAGRQRFAPRRPHRPSC